MISPYFYVSLHYRRSATVSLESSLLTNVRRLAYKSSAEFFSEAQKTHRNQEVRSEGLLRKSVMYGVLGLANKSITKKVTKSSTLSPP